MAGFSQGFHSSRYSSKITRSANRFSSTGLLPSMVALSRDILLINIHLNALPRNYFRRYPLTTPRSKFGVWALPFSLAATRGINNCSLFLRLLRCFTSAGSPPRLTAGQCRFATFRYRIRKSPDQRLLGTSPRLIAAAPRPSSPQYPKAFSICP